MFDSSTDRSYYVLTARSPLEAVRWSRKAPRSIFDIVYPTTPNGRRPPPLPFARGIAPLTSFTWARLSDSEN
jgi:hypothetical protein